MISISKCNVPHYLVDSEFYNALSSDDTEVFSVPEVNLKLTVTLSEVSHLRHLMSTLNFWGAKKYPEEVLLFLWLTRSETGQKEVRSVLSEFSLFPELVLWFDDLQEVANLNRSTSYYEHIVGPRVGADCIPVLIKCLASSNEAIVQKAQVELKRLVKFNKKTAAFIMSVLLSNINSVLVKPINELSPAIQHYIADLLVYSFQKFAHDETILQSVLPLLFHFLYGNDETLISSGCKVLKTVSNNFVHIIVRVDVLSRIVTLLSHSAHSIQADAVDIGIDINLKSSTYLQHFNIPISVNSAVCNIVHEHRQYTQTFVKLHVLATLGTVLLDTSRPKDTHKIILQALELLAIKSLLYSGRINVNVIPDHALLNELMHTYSEVISRSESPELQLSCACVIVYVHSKCFDDNPTSDFNTAWKVCVRKELIDKALASPALEGISTKYLPL